MQVIYIIPLVLFIGAIAWNSVVKLRVLWLLARRAFTTGSVRGFWPDFFHHCLEGHYTFVAALVIAVPLFLLLLVAVPLTARARGTIELGDRSRP